MSRSANESGSLFRTIHDFFFAEETPYGLALVRMLLPTAAMIPMVIRFQRVRELYSADGTPQQLTEAFGHGDLLPVFSAPIATLLFGLMLFAMFSAVLGFRTRISLLLGTPLYFYFNLLDSVGTLTKYSVIAGHVLVLLTISPCAVVWSVDALLRRRRGQDAVGPPPRVPVWSARLIQILFAAIYFGAAITKVQTEAFFTGEQMRYWMFSNWNYPNVIGEYVAMWPIVLLVSGYLTLVWELSFPFLVWRRWGRFYALGFGATFHILTNPLLGLRVFPLVCLSAYLAFLSERDVLVLRRWLPRGRDLLLQLQFPFRLAADLISRRPAGVPLSVLWGLLAAIVGVGSMEWDYQLDHYGIRANGGPLPLQKIDTLVARRMINSTTPIRERDKFFSFDIGSRIMAGQLVNRSREFEYGEMLIAQCNLNKPHEDLWVECVVEDEQQRVLDVTGKFVTREQLHAYFPYALNSRLLPGDYWMVLKSSGVEISRRPFRLSGDPAAACPTDSIMTN